MVFEGRVGTRSSGEALRIGVSARWLELPPGGAREYTECLIQALLACDIKNQYVVFYSNPRRQGTFPGAVEITLPGRNKIIWDYISLPGALKRERIDLFWTPSYIVPFPVKCRSVATVLDLAYLTMPRAYRYTDVLYMRLAMPGSFRRANALLCISEHTRQDLERLFPFAKPKASVTPLGLHPRYRMTPRSGFDDEVRSRYALRQPYLFYAGSLSPRKGVPQLLEAFSLLKREQRIPHLLVLTGGWNWGNVNAYRMADSVGLRDQVMILGEVPSDHMPALYRLADLFVYPSLYEGFGLPVLEAMACGCPVVCSKLTSLPEVAGDAAVLVDPKDTARMAAEMYRALVDKDVRAMLMEKGLRRSQGYTWEATAHKTLKVFERVMQG